MTSLPLEVGSRARLLFEQLESNFAAFINGLPAGLKELAVQRGTYHGDFSLESFAGLASLNPVLVGSPWLFWECFQGSADREFLLIAEAGAYCVLASVVLDHLVDGQTGNPGLLSLYHQALYSHSLRGYQQVLIAGSPFWEHFERLERLHLTGLASEIHFQGQPREYTLDTLRGIAHGKVAPIVTTLAGMCGVAGKLEIFSRLEVSLNEIAVASQLLDDIGDWEEDLQSRHLTYFLAQLVDPEAWQEGRPISAGEVQEALQRTWLDVEGFKQVRLGLDHSLEAVADLDCPVWVRYVQVYQDLTDGHLERVVRLRLGSVLRGK